MRIITTVKNFLLALTKRDFFLIVASIVGFTVLVSGFIIYRYYDKINFFNQQLRRLNNERAEAQELLGKDLQIKQQQAVVEEVLKKNKTFYLLQYFDTVTSKLRLDQYVKDKRVTTNELENVRAQGYTEIKLDVSIININMQQLAQLLYEIEQNELVSTRRLEITKANKLPAVDVEMTIATLQPKAE